MLSLASQGASRLSTCLQVARLIDRPIRPLISKGWSCETQLASYVLSFDGVVHASSSSVLGANSNDIHSIPPILVVVSFTQLVIVLDLHSTGASVARRRVHMAALIIAHRTRATILIMSRCVRACGCAEAWAPLRSTLCACERVQVHKPE